MKYKIDVVRIRENSIQLNGWVIGKTPESKAEFEVLDQNKKPLEIKCVATRRDDVSQIYYKQVYDRDYGFDIQFPYERGADYWQVIRCDGRTARVKYNEELIAKRASVAHKRMEKIRDLMNMETVHVALEFGKKHGLKALLLKSRHKLQGLDNDYDYGEWYELTIRRRRSWPPSGRQGSRMSRCYPSSFRPTGHRRNICGRCWTPFWPRPTETGRYVWPTEARRVRALL